MADIAQSILDRLKMKARSSGKDYQLLLQLFCQEEFQYISSQPVLGHIATTTPDENK